MTRSGIEAWVAPLGDFFSEKLGQKAHVSDLRRLAEGHSRQMLLAHVEAGETTHRYVVRIEQGGIFGTSSAEEYRIMRALFEAGFPVAQVRWLEPSKSLLGEPFFVMDYVDGEPDPPPDESLREFVVALERLHHLDWEKAGLDFELKPTSAQESTHMQVERWLKVSRESTALPVPLLEEAAAWLHHHAPSEGRMCVVHGDPTNPGNVRVTADRVALIDWDESHVDVPDLDLALPHNAAGLDDDAHDIAAQASAAWEAAVCWDDEYAIRRLAEVRAV